MICCERKVLLVGWWQLLIWSNLGHTAKARFAMYDEIGRTAKVWHTTKREVAVCLNKGPTAKDAHTAKEGSLPCA